MIRQVPGVDAAFLAAETAGWHFHVSMLVMLETDGSDQYSFDAVRETLANRIHRVPQFRWKLRAVPFSAFARPYWIDDDTFDLDRHLTHVALPEPGDDRALARLVGRLLSTRLDRTRPLWEMWVIDGLTGGRSAVLAKVHHAIVDGQSGTELATVLFDLERQPEPDPPPPPWQPDPAPSGPAMLGDIAQRAAGWPVRAAQLGRQFARQGTTYIGHTFGPTPTTHPFQAPRTPFNATLTPSRSFASATMSLADAKAVKDAFGVKLNDVVLAVVAGVLRSYLLDLDQLPAQPLVAVVPVSMRSDGDAHIGTKISMMFSAIATDIADPAERLRSIHATTSAAKDLREALTADQITSLSDNTAPGLVAAVALAWTAGGLDSAVPPVFNAIVSNVPGPSFDLFLAGAPIAAMYPMGPLLFGSGLNFTIVSNAMRLDIGVLACPDLVPDAWDVADRVGPAFDELVSAAGRLR